MDFQDVGPWSASRTWFGIDSGSYGNFALDEIMFRLDGEGTVQGAELKAFRLVLDKRL